MLQGFWGGVILSIVNQTIVFLVLGGLALAIVLVQKVVHRFESRTVRPAVGPKAAPPRGPARQPKPPVAAIVAAVHAFSGATPGTLRIVGLRRVGAANPWKAAGRVEALGMTLTNGDRLE
jgi:Na+-transporting methylmalonyl-CoA/oxaloacetate decarboxylase gamma subunit